MWRRGPGKRQERGVALVLVIWAIGVLAFTAAQLSIASRLSYSETHSERDLLTIEYLFEGAIRRATSDWDTGIASKAGDIYTCSLPQGMLSFKVVPANARVSLNASSERTLSELLQALGADQALADQYAAAIVDYRDADSLAQPGGAEQVAYRSAGRDHTPKNAPLDSGIELHYIPGLSTQMIERLRDETSAQNHNPSIDLNYASDIAKDIVSSAARSTSRSETGRTSNRDVRPRLASQTLGAGPIIIVSSVSLGSLRRSVEVTLGRRSNVTRERRLLEYRPIYHYHLPHRITSPRSECFIDTLSED